MRTAIVFLQAAVAALLAGSVALGQSDALSQDRGVERAARAQDVIATIQKDHHSGNLEPKVHTLAEEDLNALLLMEVKARPETGLENLSVQLQPDDTFTTFLTVDLDRVQVQLNSFLGSIFQSLLGGKQALEVEGVLKTEAGEGTYEVLSASLNGIPVPALVVESILQAVGSRLDPPFDPSEGFILLDGIQKVEILQDQVKIFTGKQ